MPLRDIGTIKITRTTGSVETYSGYGQTEFVLLSSAIEQGRVTYQATEGHLTVILRGIASLCYVPGDPAND